MSGATMTDSSSVIATQNQEYWMKMKNKAPDQVDIAVHNQACVVVHTQNDQPELFGEDDNKPEKLENEILSRTKNKLYDIFIKQCGNKEPTCFEMSQVKSFKVKVKPVYDM